MELRGLTIPYAKTKAKNIRRKEREIQKRLSDLDQFISSASRTLYQQPPGKPLRS